MSITEQQHDQLDALPQHPQLDCLDYWTKLPTHVESMIGPGDVPQGYLITHETETHEICLVTSANRAFVRDRRNGEALYRHMSPDLCGLVETYFRKQTEGGDQLE